MKKNRRRKHDLALQYIVDHIGKKTGVILSMETFEQLMEEIEDVYFGVLAQAAFQHETEYI